MTDYQRPFWLTYDDIAKEIGVKVTSVRRYRRRGDIPEPDGYFGATPYWNYDTIDDWKDNRGSRTRKSGNNQPIA